MSKSDLIISDSNHNEINSPPQLSKSITQRAILGSFITVGGTFVGLTLRLASSLIMTRLLFPEAFGLMTIVFVFLIGIQMFSDFGIRDSIIKNHRGEERNFLDTAWTIGVVRGFVIWLIICVLAWPYSIVNNQPSLFFLLPAAGITALIGGFGSTKEFVLFRNINYGLLTILDLFSQSIGLIIMISLAWYWRSVWVLIIGANFQTLTRVVLGHCFFPKPMNRFCWDRSVIVEISHMGKFILFTTMLSFLINQGDKLILGQYLSLAMLGVYGTAYSISDAPVGIVMGLCGKILFPAFSQLSRNNPSNLVPAINRVRKYMDMITLPAIGFLVVFGSRLIHILYDSRYEDAGWMLQILGIRCAVYPTYTVAAATLLSLGQAKYGLFSQISKVVALILGIPLGWYLAGIFGVIWAIAIADFFLVPAFWVGLKRHGLLKISTEILGAGYFLAGLGLAYSIAWFFSISLS